MRTQGQGMSGYRFQIVMNNHTDVPIAPSCTRFLQEDFPDMAARRLSRRMSRSDAAAAAAVAAGAPHDDQSATDSASATAEETLTAGSSAAGPTPAAEAVETAAQAAAVVLGASPNAEGTDTAVEAETEGDPAADVEKQEAEEPEGEDAEGPFNSHAKLPKLWSKCLSCLYQHCFMTHIDLEFEMTMWCRVRGYVCSMLTVHDRRSPCGACQGDKSWTCF